MDFPLAKNWWSLVLRGILAMVFGIVTFLWPGITIAVMVMLFGAYALINGILGIVGAVRAARSHERWAGLLIDGVAGIGAAVVTVLFPPVTALALVMLVAVWAIVTGVAHVVAAIRLRREITGEWLLALTGVLSIIFGILLVISPIAGAIAIALWIGAYALIFGSLLIGLGLRLRALMKGLHGRSPVPLPSS